MKTKSRWVGLLLSGVLVILGGLPASAQDDQAEERRYPRLYVELSTWVAQAAGLEFEPVSQIDIEDPFNTEILKMSHGTQAAGRYRFGFDLGRNAGKLRFTWYSHHETGVTLSDSRPNDFVFGQLLSFPLYAGFSNDGLADAFSAEAESELRDFRVDYQRTAFRSDRAVADWFVGVRRVQHQRTLDATYYALEPLLPPLIPPFSPPRPDLDPLPETARVASLFKGRGIEAGLDVWMPLLQNKKLEAEGGLALAVLRGKTDASYRSINALYVLDGVALVPPYDEFEELELVGGVPTPVVERIEQATVATGVKTESRSTTSQVLEAYFGLRWHAWKGLDVFAGFRSASYDRVGLDLRVDEGSLSELGLNIERLTETHRSATYEGFYGGIAWGF